MTLIKKLSLLTCTMSPAPMPFQVLTKTVKTGSLDVGTISDKELMMNIMPFPICLRLPNPIPPQICIPQIQNWLKPSGGVYVMGKKVLTKKSSMTCSLGGGTLRFLTAQMTVKIGK
jgi:hypothetical protein